VSLRGQPRADDSLTRVRRIIEMSDANHCSTLPALPRARAHLSQADPRRAAKHCRQAAIIQKT
jgi:hypothetical protein